MVEAASVSSLETHGFRLSASRLSTWMTCPLQAKFQYIDRLPRKQNASASFGSCMHHALDVYTRTHDVEGAVATFKDVWTNPEKLGVTPETWPQRQTFGGLMARGLDMLRDYHEKLKWENREVIATEHKFLVPFGEFELTGAVDLLEVKKDSKGKPTLRIVDFKTNQRAPFISNLRLNIQFTIYDYASRQPEFWAGNGPDFPGIPNGEWLMEINKDLPRRGVWYGLLQSKEYDAGPRDDADFLRLYRVAREMKKALEHDVYVPNISGDSCTFCPFTKPCQLPIEPRTYNPEDES